MKILEQNPALATKLAELCRQWKVRELALFGSTARGDEQPQSDVDVLVTFTAEARWDLFDIVDFREELGRFFQRTVDVVEASSVHNPFRRAMIDREKRILYAA
jgi:predicted nucleotidyltransferase